MYSGAYEEYLENEVLTADPIKLIQILYRGALDAIAGARRALAAGEIAERSRLIIKAVSIVNELALSLDHSRAPVLCRSLVELYDYMARRLNAANAQQTEDGLIEVENLLSDLLGTWQQVGLAERQQQEELPATNEEPQHISCAY